MADVVWTKRAQADLAEIADYHAAQSPAYAEVLVRRLLAAAERLSAFPESGRVVPEIGDELMREVVYRNYRVIYLHSAGEGRKRIGLICLAWGIPYRS
ncbi:type II toxin-antitoxin system RelE/ParE family toxin, partial [Rubrivirga litoralis]